MIPLTPHMVAAIFHVVTASAAETPAGTAQQPPGAQPRPPALAAADNLADAGGAILKCYHHTATYRAAQVVQRPWNRQTEFGAAQSALIRIEYDGMTGAHHVMLTGLMVRPNAIRAFVVEDANAIGYNKKCELMQWVHVAAPSDAAARK